MRHSILTRNLSLGYKIPNVLTMSDYKDKVVVTRGNGKQGLGAQMPNELTHR